MMNDYKNTSTLSKIKIIIQNKGFIKDLKQDIQRKFISFEEEEE